MAIGDITGEIASLEWDTEADYPDIIHIAGNIYAIAYPIPFNDGQLKTIGISDDGLTLSIVASLEWDTDQGDYPDIIHIAGNIYAIAYMGPGAYGWLKTVSISEDGSTLSTVESLVWDTDEAEYPDIIHIVGNIYAIAYSGGPDYGGWLKTVSISDDGLTLSTVESLEWDTEGYYPDIIHIAGNIYAIAYKGPGAYGWLKTVSISEDGSTLSTVESLVWDTDEAEYPDIIHIAGNIYAIAYKGPGGDGLLKTVSISDDGLTLSTVESFEWDTVDGYYPNIIHIAGNIYAIAYTIPGDCGWLKTVSISDDGLTLSTVASLEWDPEGYYPDIIHTAGNIYAIAYRGTGDEGWLKTVGIETTAAAARHRFTGGFPHRSIH